MKKIFTLLTALCLPVLASAENALKLVTCSGEAGGQVTLDIDMTNDVDIIAFRATLILPEGFTLIEDEEEETVFLQTGRATNEDGYGNSQVNYISERIRGNEAAFAYVPLFQGKNLKGVISAGTGTVVTARLKIDEKMQPGSYEIRLEDIEMATAESVKDPENLNIWAENVVTSQTVGSALEVKAKGDLTAIGSIQAENEDATTAVYDLSGRCTETRSRMSDWASCSVFFCLFYKECREKSGQNETGYR